MTFNNNPLPAPVYDFTDTARYLNEEYSIPELIEDINESALSLAMLITPGFEGADLIGQMQCVALHLIDLLKTIKVEKA